jgi:hypothetical protein
MECRILFLTAARFLGPKMTYNGVKLSKLRAIVQATRLYGSVTLFPLRDTFLYLQKACKETTERKRQAVIEIHSSALAMIIAYRRLLVSGHSCFEHQSPSSPRVS